MSTETFRVEGMTCASCVRRVEQALARVPGVREAHVNLALNEATVQGEGFDRWALASALEEKGYGLAETDHRPDDEAAGFRALAAGLLSLPLLALMVPGLHLPWLVQAALSAVVVFGAGSAFFKRAGTQALHGDASMDTLVALGAGVSWCFGLAEGLRGAHHLTFETAAGLVAFLLVGRWLEARAKGRATQDLQALVRLAPALALRLTDQGEAEVSVALLHPGDRVRVLPGSAIPVDGEILGGSADVEEALLTGEPMPVPRGIGDRVMAGAIVHGGSLEIRVEAAGRDTWLARLARQVAEAQSSRAPLQDLADRVSAVFVPAVLVLGVLTLAGWWLATGTLAWRPAVTLLVIACPCALGLATPVALTTALGAAARHGLLVRDAQAFDRLAHLTDLAFDKTGTLTEGRPEVLEVRALGDLDRGTLLRFAAALERDSEHPLARGIRKAAEGLELPPIENFQAFPGGGVAGDVSGVPCRLGSQAFLGFPFPYEPVPKPPRAALGAPGGVPPGRRDEHSGSTRFEPDAGERRPPPQPGGTSPGGRSAASSPLNDEQHRPAGLSLQRIPPDDVAAHGGFGTGSYLPAAQTAVGLMVAGRPAGLLLLGDTPRAEAPAILAELRGLGLNLHLLSGDRPAAVQAAAEAFGLGSAHGGLSPDAKRDFLVSLQTRGAVVGFVGDGVNDALALAQADAGLSMAGLDATQVAAPLNALRPGLGPLLMGLKLARRTRIIIRQNLAWAFGYNLLLVPLAALGQLERFGGPMLAGAAMGLSSLTVVLNALRLRQDSSRGARKAPMAS